jgi:hypothetical protein
MTTRQTGPVQRARRLVLATATLAALAVSSAAADQAVLRLPFTQELTCNTVLIVTPEITGKWSRCGHPDLEFHRTIAVCAEHGYVSFTEAAFTGPAELAGAYALARGTPPGGCADDAAGAFVQVRLERLERPAAALGGQP